MRALLRLKPYLRPHLGLLIASSLLAIPLSAIRLGPAPLVQKLVDDLLVNKQTDHLYWLPIGVIGLYLLNFVVRFLHYYTMRVVIARVDMQIKNDLFEHLLGLSADYFTAQSNGQLMARVVSDPVYISQGIQSFSTLLREPLTLLFVFGYAFYLNWQLTMITLVIIPPLTWIFTTTGRNLKRYIGQLNQTSGGIYSTLQEGISGIRVVKLFRLEKYVHKKFRKDSGHYMKVILKTAVLEETSHPMVELMTAFAIAPLLYLGGSQVIENKMTAGELTAFFSAFALMMNPIRLMNDLNLKMAACAAACQRVFEVLDWRSHIVEPTSPKQLETLRESIEVKGVSFAYPDTPERVVLKDVSFRVPKGKVVALVGASGAGKSSLVSLLPRVFDVTQGSIRIDGVDIRDFKLEDLRQLIAVVSQDVFLFNDTIEENIRCGKLSATREEIREAARRAHATEFIDRLPGGFKAVIGDRGQKLSGGERQRLSIARAFLRESPILILDEATSSLDSASERAVQTALEELMVSRTTLVIAHRLSTIRNADEILLLQEGKVLERGTHQSLLAMRGEYARFHSVLGGSEALGVEAIGAERASLAEPTR